MKYINKKGQIMQELGALGIGVAVITLVLIIAFLVMSQITTQAISQGEAAAAITNETVVWTYDTWVALSRSPNSMLLSCSQVYNGTGFPSEEIDVSNYTCGTKGIKVINGSNVFLNYSIEVWYSYKDKSAAFNSTGVLTNATATIPDWVPLIILVSIGGIILGLVSAFKRR